MGDINPTIPANGTDGEVLWRIGDPWRDFRPIVTPSGGLIAAVTGGAVRVLDPDNQVHLRLPVDGSTLVGDGLSLELKTIEVFSPCGLIVWGSTRYSNSESTRVLFVARLGPSGQLTPCESFGDPKFTIDTHPAGECGARYCYRLYPPDEATAE